MRAGHFRRPTKVGRRSVITDLGLVTDTCGGTGLLLGERRAGIFTDLGRRFTDLGGVFTDLGGRFTDLGSKVGNRCFQRFLAFRRLTRASLVARQSPRLTRVVIILGLARGARITPAANMSSAQGFAVDPCLLPPQERHAAVELGLARLRRCGVVEIKAVIEEVVPADLGSRCLAGRPLNLRVAGVEVGAGHHAVVLKVLLDFGDQLRHVGAFLLLPDEVGIVGVIPPALPGSPQSLGLTPELFLVAREPLNIDHPFADLDEQEAAVAGLIVEGVDGPRVVRAEEDAAARGLDLRLHVLRRPQIELAAKVLLDCRHLRLLEGHQLRHLNDLFAGKLALGVVVTEIGG